MLCACVLQNRKQLMLSVETAMALFQLENLEVVRDPLTDGKCLIAWGPTMLVLAFRGTASRKNMRTDAKVCTST